MPGLGKTYPGTLIWWDATVRGDDEGGTIGAGMWRYINDGKRYLFGQFPKGDQPWFQAANTVTVFTVPPGPDSPPNYRHTPPTTCAGGSTSAVSEESAPEAQRKSHK